ncbi:MAG: transposase, partial [Candidatus Delongbacteria bacterium]|nr:transposase [Candidatus Delongbacteria bacterium]
MRRLKPYHITWATHNSRRSPRMLHYSGEPKYYVWLTNEEEIIIAESIAESVEKDKLNVKAFNICGDHVHILMVCQKEDIPKIIHNLKGRSSRALSVWYENGIQLDNGINPIALPGNPIIQERQSTSTWAQKYNV